MRLGNIVLRVVLVLYISIVLLIALFGIPNESEQLRAVSTATGATTIVYSYGEGKTPPKTTKTGNKINQDINLSFFTYCFFMVPL